MPTLWWKELTSNFSVLGFAVRESGYPDKAFNLCGKELKKSFMTGIGNGR